MEQVEFLDFIFPQRGTVFALMGWYNMYPFNELIVRTKDWEKSQAMDRED